MHRIKRYSCLLLCAILLGSSVVGQEVAYDTPSKTLYDQAYDFAYNGKHGFAKKILKDLVSGTPDDVKARTLLASTYSWSGQYEKARSEFNKITSTTRNDRAVWIAAIKNELYAKENATAFGLANKALFFLQGDKEVERLKVIAQNRIETKTYPKLGWHNQDGVYKKNRGKAKSKKETTSTEQNQKKPKKESDRDALNNRIGVNNSVTVFSERYDPIVFSSISFRRQTLAGSIIPRINYSNRQGTHGIQYDIDFYPKFSKRFYAYLNYGYSNAAIFPNQKVGGDLYVNLPWAMEFSAGGRYIKTRTQNITAVTNSIGHYRGNYYFSLRSFITPRPDGLTRFSSNILVRKYRKDAENFMGINIGMGISPELRQFFADDTLLAETILYVESQRMSLHYQFTGKKNPNNIYRANLSVRRQELAFASGNFFWGISAGLTYQVKF